MDISGTLNVGGAATLPNIAPSSANGPSDIRNWFASTGATCSNVASAVTAAYAAGVRRLYLPANCTYITNSIAQDLEIFGESWETSIVTTTDQTTQSLMMAPHSVLANVGVEDQFCYASTSPGNTIKVCPTPWYENVSDATQPEYNWPFEITLNGGATSTLNGVTSTDVPLIGISENSTGGDGIFVGTGNPGLGFSATGASGIRMVTQGQGDNGLYLLDGLTDGTNSNQHYGIFAKDLAYNASGRLIYLDRVGNGTNVNQSVLIADTDAPAGASFTTDNIGISLAHQTAGNFLNLYHSVSAFSGDAIIMNFGNSGGTFTGNFVDARIAGTSKWVLPANGIPENLGGSLIGAHATSLPTASISAVANTDFSTNGDQYVNVLFHLSGQTTNATIFRLTSDGLGGNSSATCGFLGANTATSIRNLTITATDVTNPANAWNYYQPFGVLRKQGTAPTTTWTAVGAALAQGTGSTTGAAATISADTSQSCLKVQWQAPTGNTDTWHVVASFQQDIVQ